MEDLIVGEGSLDIHSLAKAIEKSKQFVTLVQNWRGFGACLELDDVKLLDLERRIKLGDLQLREIPREVMKIWKADKGTNATLKVLHEALVENGGKDIAEDVVTQFLVPESTHALKFVWQEKEVTLEYLLGENISLEISQKIFDEMKHSFPEKPIPILKDQLTPPGQPKFYIPRTLLYLPSTEVDQSIFTAESDLPHVFLFKGMRKHDIAVLSGYQEVGRSGDHLRGAKMKFIELEYDEDFLRIGKNTVKPVHMIEHKEGRYFWVKSSKDSDFIRQYLKEDVKIICEQRLASRIASLPPPFTLSIADSPGMGKTSVLANVAVEMKQCIPTSINLFIVLQEFVQQMSLLNSSALEAIAEYSSCDQLAKLVLIEMLNMTDLYQLNLFLDGYDEVMRDKLDAVDSLLDPLQNLKNVKVIVTTRPHLQPRLEILLNQFSYQIRPLDKSDQIEFLTKYWICQHEAENDNALEEFAKQCLAALEAVMTDKEKEIAGIPLQCMMLAEVFAEDGKRASKLGIVRDNMVQPISFYEMFKKLIELKFQRSPNQYYENAHAREAITILFPNWVDTFKLWLGDPKEIDEDTLYSIGLLEKSPHQNKPRFVHRTFAEFLLAGFIVKNLGKNKECVNLLFGEILGKKGTTKEYRGPFHKILTYTYELNYPVITYFMELHLQEYAKDHVLEILLPSKHSRLFYKSKFGLEDVCATVRACCEHDLEYTFDCTSKVLYNYVVWRLTREKYFRGIPYAVVCRTNNVNLLKKVLDFTKHKFGMDLRNHKILSQSKKWYNFGVSVDLLVGIPDNTSYTPLHFVVQEGKYNFVSFLVKQYGDHITKLKYLLHVCVNESVRNSKSVIEEKLLILDLLVKSNPAWLEEKENFFRTPLLMEAVQFSLLKRLVELGADINACSKYGANVFQFINDKNTFMDTVHLAMKNKFNLIKYENSHRSPFLRAIVVCETIDDEGLKFFHEAGANFNAQDNNGNSVLFYALAFSGNIYFIKKLMEYGADVQHKNIKGQNALHKVMYGKKSPSGDDRLLIIDMLASINRGWLHEADNENCTPLLEKNLAGIDVILLQRLLEHGADINAYSSVHGTILHMYKFLYDKDHLMYKMPWKDNISLSRNNYFEVVRWAISNGFSLINSTNWRKQTALMTAIESFQTLDDEVLKLFEEAGANFNAVDENKDSVLFYALKYSDSVDFIRKILECGVDVNHTNHKKQNALHKVMEGEWNVDAGQILDALTLLKSSGFKLKKANKNDSHGHMPLYYAKKNMKKRMKYYYYEKALTEFLKADLI